MAVLVAFREGLAAAGAFSHRASVTLPGNVGIRHTLLKLYAALTDQRPLTEKPTAWDSLGDGMASLDEAYLSERGDGLVRTREPRGFMIGVGETLTYYLLVAGSALVDVEDWWEDNIADPEAYTFHIHARSAEMLERATAALAKIVDAGKADVPPPSPAAPSPAPATRATIELAIAGIDEPATAWAVLAEKSLIPPGVVGNPRWTFVKELRETCARCQGSGEDWMYDGPCSCDYGSVRVGYQRAPHPPSLQDVIQLATDAVVLLQVDAAARTLVQRLAPWGCPAPTMIEWTNERSVLVDRESFIPRCMVPLFEAMATALGDPTLSKRYSGRWFTRGQSAWAADHQRGPDPFEPLGVILGAGYYIDITAEAIRLFR